MANIILIRHAQASLGKSNYDALSPMGFKQAEILGQYIEKAGWLPQIIITGSMQRHQQTADSIINSLSHQVEHHENPDWNEFDFKSLIQHFLKMHPEQMPASGDIRAFFAILKKSMLAWSNNELDIKDQALESWEHFSQRITRAINAAQAHASERPTVIISSGGAIAMLLMQVLEVNAKTMINLNFQIRNTSFTEILMKPHKQSLVAFNQVNHLSDKQYQAMLTYA